MMHAVNLAAGAIVPRCKFSREDVKHVTLQASPRRICSHCSEPTARPKGQVTGPAARAHFIFPMSHKDRKGKADGNYTNDAKYCAIDADGNGAASNHEKPRKRQGALDPGHLGSDRQGGARRGDADTCGPEVST